MAKSPHTLSLFSSALHPATCSDDHGGHVRRGGAAWQSTGGGRAGARGERRRQWTLTWTERASPQRQTLDEATRRKGGPRRCRQSHRAHTQSTHTHRQSTHTEHTQSILRVRLNTHTHSHTYTHTHKPREGAAGLGGVGPPLSSLQLQTAAQRTAAENRSRLSLSESQRRAKKKREREREEMMESAFFFFFFFFCLQGLRETFGTSSAAAGGRKGRKRGEEQAGREEKSKVEEKREGQMDQIFHRLLSRLPSLHASRSAGAVGPLAGHCCRRLYLLYSCGEERGSSGERW